MKKSIIVKFKKRTDYMKIDTKLISFTPYSLEKGGFSQNPINRIKCYNFKTDYIANLENKLRGLSDLSNIEEY